MARFPARVIPQSPLSIAVIVAVKTLGTLQVHAAGCNLHINLPGDKYGVHCASNDGPEHGNGSAYAGNVDLEHTE